MCGRAAEFQPAGDHSALAAVVRGGDSCLISERPKRSLAALAPGSKRMIGRALATAAALAMGAAPCMAADLSQVQVSGERRSGATAGVYFAVPFGGERSGRSQAGLRLRMDHEYRDSTGRRLRAAGTDTLELRMIGEERPTLFVAEMPVTGRAGREARQNLMGGGIVNIVVIGLAVVGAFVVYNEITGDDDEAQPQ